jgi:hypothetical protein
MALATIIGLLNVSMDPPYGVEVVRMVERSALGAQRSALTAQRSPHSAHRFTNPCARA